jgi:hypothetical protein
MIQRVLYIVFFISACNITAQTVIPTDTVKTTTVETPRTVLPTDTTKTTAPGVHGMPTQTLTPIEIVRANQRKKIHKPRDPRLKPDFIAENKEITKLYRDAFDKKKEIVLQNKRYRIYNNYLTAGAGKCFNSGWKELELCTAFDFNFHIQKKYFQVGGTLVGPALWNNNCLQIHVGWGYRFERCNYQLAAYGGLSSSSGYYLQQTDSVTYKIKMNTIGAYVALQCFYKLKFDYGIGLSAFFDINAKQTLTGIKLELFFSGAYRGFKKIDWRKEDAKY